MSPGANDMDMLQLEVVPMDISGGRIGPKSPSGLTTVDRFDFANDTLHNITENGFCTF